MSELKNVSGSAKLPYGTLASGAEGIKDAISGFGDARRADIENERLPPELVDAESEEGRAYMSQPQTPSEAEISPANTLGEAPSPSALEKALSVSTSSLPSSGGPTTPTSPSSPSVVSPFRRGHGRQQSLGTTMTSPSTRRRSIESTMSLLKEASEGRERDAEFEALADQLAGASQGKKRDSAPTASR